MAIVFSSALESIYHSNSVQSAARHYYEHRSPITQVCDVLVFLLTTPTEVWNQGFENTIKKYAQQEITDILQQIQTAIEEAADTEKSVCRIELAGETLTLINVGQTLQIRSSLFYQRSINVSGGSLATLADRLRRYQELVSVHPVIASSEAFNGERVHYCAPREDSREDAQRF